MNERYAAAVAAIDAANAGDPTRVVVRGVESPLAQVHGTLAAAWVADLHPDADETWLLAARAHHLRRWELPRSTYEPGRAGYLKWKRDQRQRHARDVGELLAELGYDETTIERVQALVRRDHLAADAGSQAIEDAACLAFVETQLADVARKLDRTHLIGVLRKTAEKMTQAGAAAIARIPLEESERALLAEALGG
ncbi:MAG: DUF4202 domain-containing protein [Ilumatobacteraceae bacterium]|nr:DUF4202 domain-containing protein [Acidimicrobiales bacterium]MCB9394306.1 DUF4202 domain-containing protein [Acidimicrobiaceae bacterium]